MSAAGARRGLSGRGLHRTALPWLGAVLVLAAALRFYQLEGSSLWNDEGNSWAMLARSYRQIAAAAAADIHPPGYYWLLKLWSTLFGTSAAAMRGLSALLGVFLVGLVATLAQRSAGRQVGWKGYPLLAAFCAALNPFQIYYSQEARMYLLLAVEGAGLAWATYGLMGSTPWRPGWRIHALAFMGWGVAGLWTHYSFPVLLLAAGMAWSVDWVGALRRKEPEVRARGIGYASLNLIVLAAFLPWLPIAVDRLLNWPRAGESTGLVAGLELTLRTLLFGPLRAVPEPLWPWLVLAAGLPLAGGVALRHNLRLAALALCGWLLPVAMMFGLGLFTDAFLKFLLVASPAWCLLVAAAPWLGWQVSRQGGRVLLLGLLLFVGAAAGAVLPGYYTTPTVRDNYQGIARYLAAVGDRQRDLVVLNAPGQQEVWRYYDPGLPVLALPQQRPSDPAAVEAALQQATAGRRQVYALFWATVEADPEQQVERWLDLHAFKTLDSWQGALRFVVYTLADDLQPVHREPVRWENGIVLTGIEQAGHLPQQVEPGSAALVRLWWTTEQPLDRRYKVSLQLLDGGNQVVAQHDSEPAGGALPTDRWRAGERVADNHGVAIPFGVPPGTYRLAVVLYDGESGARLRQEGQELVVLGEVAVVPIERPVPVELLPMLQRTELWLGPVQLVGYDLYRRGFAHAPQTAVEPGDTVSLTLYWQAPDPLPARWPELLVMTVQLGEESLRVPLAGDGYPTGVWPPGALVRSTVDLVYTGAARQPVVTVDGAEIVLQPLPVR